MALRDELWASMAPLHTRILEHPFLTGLTDGTLPRASFAYFITQDSHYLREYARALAGCAAKAPTADETALFAAHASQAIAVEQQMHAEFLADLGESADAAEPPSPTTRAYASYLLATVYSGSYPEAVAAVLPCYWVYARVGATLVKASSPDPLYARWIAAYGGEEFQAVVDAVLAVVDRIGSGLSDAEAARMRGHAVATTRYEWMFWDAAWRRENWPV